MRPQSKPRLALTNKGQGLLESLIALPLLLSAGFLLFQLGYRIFLYQYLDYQLHEALVCCDSHPLAHCKNTLQKRIHGPQQKSSPLYQVSLNGNSRQTSGRILVSLTPPLLIEKKYYRQAP